MARAIRFQYPLFAAMLLLLAVGYVFGVYFRIYPPIPSDARRAQAALKAYVANNPKVFWDQEGDLNRVRVLPSDQYGESVVRVGNVHVLLSARYYWIHLADNSGRVDCGGQFELKSDGSWYPKDPNYEWVNKSRLFEYELMMQ